MSDAFTRYVITLSPVVGAATSEGLIRRHVAWLRTLEGAGDLVLAGPFVSRPGGMVIVKAASLDAARALALSDPFVREGARHCEVTEWALSCAANAHMGMG